MQRVHAWLTCGILSITILAGCGAAADGRTAVSGLITLDGTAASRGRILFTPQKGNAGPAVGGSIDTLGRYQIPADQGLRTGPYSVKITLHPVTAKDKFVGRKKQDNQTFQQTATITEAGTTQLNFDLTSVP